MKKQDFEKRVQYLQGVKENRKRLCWAVGGNSLEVAEAKKRSRAGNLTFFEDGSRLIELLRANSEEGARLIARLRAKLLKAGASKSDLDSLMDLCRALGALQEKEGKSRQAQIAAETPGLKPLSTLQYVLLVALRNAEKKIERKAAPREVLAEVEAMRAQDQSIRLFSRDRISAGGIIKKVYIDPKGGSRALDYDLNGKAKHLTRAQLSNRLQDLRKSHLITKPVK